MSHVSINSLEDVTAKESVAFFELDGKAVFVVIGV
jgi:hypothetical protein